MRKSNKQASNEQHAAPSYAKQLAQVCGTDEAAELLGVTATRVKQFCQDGRLAAKRLKRDWVIAIGSAIALAAIERPPGPRRNVSQVSTISTARGRNTKAKKKGGRRR